ncbi:GGDEF domain-containing protein [Actinoplanes sp. NEAU-H7]|uniref:GGDEF domain-containing protein n=2 Tax=Actinoplanes flavus TaxID=2820290 RepID=A0ABS3UD17_9ACTN|nr:GGDEF domain-containing protein [Actinoplanes flavus]
MHWFCAAVPYLTAVVIGAVAGRLTATPVIRRLHAQVDTLTRRALHDPLSGLLNRSGLQDAYARTAGQGRQVILVDLDAFKLANDQHGHPVGDQILSALGRRLAGLASQHDGWAGRLGGDEFAVILPAATSATAEAVAAAATAAITITDLPTGPLTVSGSAGLASVPAGYPWDSALTNADIALYHGKHAKRPVMFAAGMTYPRTEADRRRARDTTEQ